MSVDQAITEIAALRELDAFPLVEALFGRRSRRFALGDEIPDGPLAYRSSHEPVPLTELERTLVLGAMGGTTGWHFSITRHARYAPHMSNYSGGAAMGLGGWMFDGIDRFSMLGASGNPDVPGLGFRYDEDERWPTPNPTGREGVCPAAGLTTARGARQDRWRRRQCCDLLAIQALIIQGESRKDPGHGAGKCH
jgi:hypothetical protein